MTHIPGPLAFARSVFGHADLGDARRSKAAVELLAGMIQRPAGRISEVFVATSEREKAYRFVENSKVSWSALVAAQRVAVLRKLRSLPFTYMLVDGSSLTLPDHAGQKGFGPVGTNTAGARGIKVITVYAVEPNGVPLGIATQTYWPREMQESRSKAKKAADNKRRLAHEKETKWWLKGIGDAGEDVPEKKLWYVIDREGDSRSILSKLVDMNQLFTVRSSQNRLLLSSPNGEKAYLRPTMMSAPICARFTVDVPAGGNRQARQARMIVRSKAVEVVFRDTYRKTHKRVVPLNVVWAHEEAETVPPGEEPLDWMLLTNAPIETKEHVHHVLRGYRLRWRIEDFHKTWKSGHCNVEDMQLRSFPAATTWGVMQAAVAARVERLKHLARETPDAPASEEITPDEYKALVALVKSELERPPSSGGRRQKVLKVAGYTQLTIREAVDFIAQIGGYTGKSSGGPPGSTTIGRGYERLQFATRLVELLSGAAGRSDQ